MIPTGFVNEPNDRITAEQHDRIARIGRIFKRPAVRVGGLVAEA
jgi:hypothetical protein